MGSASLAWSQEAKLYRSGAVTDDHYGTSLSIYDDTVVVGAPGDDETLNDAGAVYIWVGADAKWNQTAKIVAADKAEEQRFGSSVSLSASTLAVVSQGPRDGSGNFGGSMYIFAKSPSHPGWSQQIRVSGAQRTAGDRFGASVSVFDNYVASGAPRDGAGGSTAGAAYFLKCVTTTTTTPKRGVEVTTRPPTAEQLAALRTKAVTNGAGGWSPKWLIPLFGLLPLSRM